MDFAIFFNQLRAQVIELHARKRACGSPIESLNIDVQLKLCYYYLLKFNCSKSYSENDKLIIMQFEFDGDVFDIPPSHIRHNSCNCNPEDAQSNVEKLAKMQQLLKTSEVVPLVPSPLNDNDATSVNVNSQATNAVDVNEESQFEEIKQRASHDDINEDIPLSSGNSVSEDTPLEENDLVDKSDNAQVEVPSEIEDEAIVKYEMYTERVLDSVYCGIEHEDHVEDNDEPHNVEDSTDSDVGIGSDANDSDSESQRPCCVENNRAAQTPNILFQTNPRCGITLTGEVECLNYYYMHNKWCFP